MNFISKNMLAIALLLSANSGLFGMSNVVDNTPAAETFVQQAGPVVKDFVNGVGAAASKAYRSPVMQASKDQLKNCVNAACAGFIANAKIVVPQTLKYAFFTWGGDGSYADIAGSVAAKVAVGAALWQGYGLAEDAIKWWSGPADPRGYIKGFISKYNHRGKLRSRPITKVAVASAVALGVAIGMTA